ncbi:TBC1 domain family member 2B isoform X3 [Eptesicus fuscus]|uniref:TBC1 domain family member 2B isoform X3 n=1 Tax=Eptesicus fuscus TaxID=29078 RepID=UPI0024047FE0|nr:TBC1 domain family member 2B isoform X3 [Eptesicus fuscus]
MPGPGPRADEGGGGGEGAGPGREPARLCGYLQKLSGKGPLRGYRSRWFVFDARRCSLYYFRSPQDALPLGRLDIADACFSYDGPDEAAEPGAEPPAHFQVHSAGAVTVLKAPNRQLMTYWLQELQQKRWEYCNGLDMVKWGGRTSPTPGDCSQGLVARGAPDFLYPHPNASAEKARNILAVDAAPGELVGEQAASQPSPGPPNSINFSLKQWGAELRNSMSSFRPGRGHEGRKSVFYTHEEWELLDPSPKDLEESATLEERRRPAPEGNRGGAGSGFLFDLGRVPYKGKRPLKDMIGSYKSRHSSGDPAPEGTPGAPGAGGASWASDPDTQRQLQSQREELERLRKDLSSQKELVRLLQQTVRSSQYDKYFASSRLCDGAPQDTLALLHQKDDQILGLARQLDLLGLEKESLQQEVRTLKAKVGELSEQLGMLMETIRAKDEVIIKLSRQLSEGEGRAASPTPAPGSPTACRDQQELDRLKDNLQGYKTQNKFLNKEILELSALRRNAERRERDLMAKRVRHLRVPDGPRGRRGGEAGGQGAGAGPPGPVAGREPGGVHGGQVGELPGGHHDAGDGALAGAEGPGAGGHPARAPVQGVAVVRGPAHAQAAGGRGARLLRGPAEGGAGEAEPGLAADRAGPAAHAAQQPALRRPRLRGHPAAAQRAAGLLLAQPRHRLLPGPQQAGGGGPAVPGARGRLLVPGRHRRGVHAKRLLHQDSPGLPGGPAGVPGPDGREAAAAARAPGAAQGGLHAHHLQLVPGGVRGQRGQRRALPDLGLLPVIFRFALALFKYKEEEILKLQDSMSIFKYLRYFTRTILDARKLIGIAFGDLNPFPLRQIRNRRALHLEKVRLELTELEAIREDFLRERDASPDKGALVSDEEDT